MTQKTCAIGNCFQNLCSEWYVLYSVSLERSAVFQVGLCIHVLCCVYFIFYFNLLFFVSVFFCSPLWGPLFYHTVFLAQSFSLSLTSLFIEMVSRCLLYSPS